MLPVFRESSVIGISASAACEERHLLPSLRFGDGFSGHLSGTIRRSIERTPLGDEFQRFQQLRRSSEQTRIVEAGW